MKLYARPVTSPNPKDPTFQQTPKTDWNVGVQMIQWEERITTLLISPSAVQYQKTTKAIRVGLVRSQIQDLEVQTIQKRLHDQDKRKTASRQSVQTGGPLQASEAIQKLTQKRALQRTTALKRAKMLLQDRSKRAQKA